MILFFDKKTERNRTKELFSLEKDNPVYNQIIELQNKLSVFSTGKIICVSSLDFDLCAAGFGKAMADIYDANGEATLLIDANLYNPLLKSTLKEIAGENEETTENKIKFGEKSVGVSFKKETYPVEAIKEKIINGIIKKEGKNYQRIIVVVPDLNKHEDIVLFKEICEYFLVIVRKSETPRKEINKAINFAEEKGLQNFRFVIMR